MQWNKQHHASTFLFFSCSHSYIFFLFLFFPLLFFLLLLWTKKTSVVVKLPQLVSLYRSQSTVGLSLSMYSVELFSQCISVLYHRAHGFPLATYGENLSLLNPSFFISSKSVSFSFICAISFLGNKKEISCSLFYSELCWATHFLSFHLSYGTLTLVCMSLAFPCFIWFQYNLADYNFLKNRLLSRWLLMFDFDISTILVAKTRSPATKQQLIPIFSNVLNALFIQRSIVQIFFKWFSILIFNINTWRISKQWTLYACVTNET